ncbi:FAD-linked oxidase [Thioclava sp. SK-1]|uniref:FAD-binding oxidoreductase n=1 Tax=Thioclava sp. SK-1 TaxID=1889770 RepID=UPI0008242FDC|nr:FAD-binding oxidoreductase [Thioclava sp. SK-1]OCX66248.1 FAD-linked oxidase [Thioclava sp. SK-1]
MKLSGWGRYPQVECTLHHPRDAHALRDLVTQAGAEAPVIARGNGRAYGDAALAPTGTVSMCAMDQMIHFDAQTGVLQAQAGVLLADVISAFLPRGWFPMVTPGTRFVTLGGMAAADVHGKNHHIDGSFRSCVVWLDLMRPDGSTVRVTPDKTPDLFDRTLGGMGLTGVILQLCIRLTRVETGWIHQHTIDAPNLDAAMAAFEDNPDATYSVAWIDCLAKGAALGRSLVMLGEHATLAQLPANLRRRPLQLPPKPRKAIRMTFPMCALNRWSVKAFNALYYWKSRRKTNSFVDWESYFYPLDAVLGWNRIYGRKGFVQFQCVLPLDRSADGMRALLSEISAAGQGSFLAVLKRFGAQDSAFSFPTEGYTLALDFPATPACLALLTRLEPIVADHGGRFYLAKDAVLSAQRLRETDGRAKGFADTRLAQGEAGVFSSAQSARLKL